MDPISIEYLCEGCRVQGRFFPGAGKQNPVTFLFVPGWPGEPEDFLGLGPRLSDQGINWLEFYPRGLYQSEGIYTPTGALQDIAAGLQWLNQPEVREPFKVDGSRLVLAGFSNGGGLAWAYAAWDPTVRHLVSCATNDFGQFARHLIQHRTVEPIPALAGMLDWLTSTQAPDGPAHCDMDYVLQEIIDHPEVLGLRENAARLADRSILMFGGWEDQGPTIEAYQLPFYRALKAAGAQDVTFIVYHTTHNFPNVRERLAADITAWIDIQFPPSAD